MKLDRFANKIINRQIKLNQKDVLKHANMGLLLLVLALTIYMILSTSLGDNQ